MDLYQSYTSSAVCRRRRQKLRGFLVQVHGSGCHRRRGCECFEIHLVRGSVLEGLMRAACVVKAEVLRERSACLRAVRVPVQIDLFVLDAAPQSLDEHVVDPATLAVHADGDAGVIEHLDPLLAGELRALVGVEDLRGSEPGLLRGNQLGRCASNKMAKDHAASGSWR